MYEPAYPARDHLPPGEPLSRKSLSDAELPGSPVRKRIAGLVKVFGRAIRHPDRAVLRLLLRSRVARPSAPVDRRRLLGWVSKEFGVDAERLYAEYLASDFRRWFVARRQELREFTGYQRYGTSTDLSLEGLYVLVRAAKPRVVVETGVLYGASSAHILAALACNGEGRLHSIDLPHKSAEPPHDFLVPNELAGRWTLRLGDSRNELPVLLRRLDSIDFFYHDSLHTFQHMIWEYQTVLPHLTPFGVLGSHDVRIAHSLREVFRQNAFLAFCDRHHLRRWTFQNSGFALRRTWSANQKVRPRNDGLGSIAIALACKSF